MRNRWTFFVASRYFRARNDEGSAASSMLSSLGIALGTAILIVVVGVMNGFQSGPIGTILEVSSGHVMIDGGDAELARKLVARPGARSAVPVADLEGIALSGDTGFPVRVRALPPGMKDADPGFADVLANPELDEALAEKGTALVGRELARSLALMRGSRMRVMIVRADEEEGMTPVVVPLEVSGTFATGYFEYDMSLAFVSMETAKESFGLEEADKTVVKLVDPASCDVFVAGIEAEGLVEKGRSTSWRESNRSFFGALQLEKNLLMAIVGLVYLVVGINIFHSMRRTVYEKAEEVAILKALGANDRDIRSIFMADGFAIGIIGSLAGAVLGTLLAVNINPVFAFVEWVVNGFSSIASGLGGGFGGERFGIFSSSVFYLTEVPVVLRPEELAFILAAATLSSIAAAAAASRRLESFLPAEILHAE